MNTPPRSPKENLFAGGMIPRILISGGLMTAAALFIQWWAVKQGYPLRAQQSMVFTTLCFVQLGNALSVRSVYHSLISKHFFANRALWEAIIVTIILQLLLLYIPLLQPVFKTVPLSLTAMTTILMVMLVCIFCIELAKYAYKKKFESQLQ